VETSLTEEETKAAIQTVLSNSKKAVTAEFEVSSSDSN